jgi:signal transduction histidine kinase/streptogramin lyase
MAAVLSFAQQKAESNSERFRVVNWTSKDRLPVGDGHTMIKDNRGFLWIGVNTGGFCRFDGAVFKKYPAGKQKNGAPNFTNVFLLKEDSLHNIWLGTDKGLSRYDVQSDTFTNFAPYIDSAFPKLQIAPFWSTKDEMFCIEPGSMITAINIRTLIRRPVTRFSPTVDPKVHMNTNKSIFDAATNSVWKLHTSGLGRLEHIFLDGRTYIHDWPCYKKDIKHTHDAEDMHYDPKRKSIWVNSGDGLLEFSLVDTTFRRIETLSNPADAKDYNRGVGIDIDRNGRIWFSSYFKGIFIYDPETNQMEAAFSDTLQYITGDANMHLYCDPEGIVWTSNWNGNGIYQLIPANQPIKRYLPKPGEKNSLSSGLVSTIIQGPQGKLWMGTADGINIFDPLKESFEVLREKDLPGVKGTAIIPLYIDTVRQVAWLNAGSQETYEKYFGMTMYEMDLKTRKCIPIVFKKGPERIGTFAVLHTLVRPFRDGILFCDEKHGILEASSGKGVANLVINLAPPDGFGALTLVDERYLFLQHSEVLPNSAFENRNGKWVKISTPIDSLNWTSVIYDNNSQTYWVSFSDKLIQFTKEFNEIKSFAEEDGYTSFFMNMELDDDGNLWFINKARQLGRFNPVTGLFTYFSQTDGYFKKDFVWFPPITKDKDGTIYTGIGWQTGIHLPNWWIDRIYPKKYSAVNSVRAYFSSFTVNQKTLPQLTGINNLEKVHLRYDQNVIRIETGIINFYSKEKGNIRYKLEKNGGQGEWIYPNDHIIRLEDLRPADYRLTLQASNESKEFIGPVKILAIHISPPYWQTWWFRALVVLVIIGMIYGYVQYRSRNLKHKNILLEKKVNERTNELNNSLSELKTTQSQLIHSEKMASLGELTSGIAHEIKNPLNFINNFSELNLDLLTDVNEEQLSNLDDTTRAELVHIIKTLKKNSEKINHHGKRVDDIVKSMLQHSRVGNLTKEPVNVNALCEESLKLAYHGFKAKEKTFQASFETHFDPHLPQIMAIPQDLSRVLLNLFNNAFYAVHEKKKKLQPVSTDGSEIEPSYKPLVTVSTKKGNRKIVIAISDNGTGIPQRIISKIFQPFFTTKPTGEGTGLGLSMSYDIITKSHGGELHVKSEEGKGTDFEIVMPVS